jgi:uncharacterized membrane protein YqjE
MTPESAIHLFRRARPVGRALLDGASHRLRLALVELAGLRDQIFSSLMLGLGALILALLGGIAATFAIAAALWHREDRELWLALLTLAYFGVACMLAAVAALRLKRLRFLPETARQLHEDRLCVDALLRDRKPPSP